MMHIEVVLILGCVKPDTEKTHNFIRQKTKQKRKGFRVGLRELGVHCLSHDLTFM